jgi:hypothetical protein
MNVLHKPAASEEDGVITKKIAVCWDTPQGRMRTRHCPCPCAEKVAQGG